MSKPANESADITDMIKDEKTPIEHPFNRESSTDVVVKVENTSLYLHSSVFKVNVHQCSE